MPQVSVERVDRVWRVQCPWQERGARLELVDWGLPQRGPSAFAPGRARASETEGQLDVLLLDWVDRQYMTI